MTFDEYLKEALENDPELKKEYYALNAYANRERLINLLLSDVECDRDYSCEECKLRNGESLCVNECAELTADAIIADGWVRLPLQHGKWVETEIIDDDEEFGVNDDAGQCSVCGHTDSSYEFAKNNYYYCPNCGAKMDGKE